jgi:hypothetical protein
MPPGTIVAANQASPPAAEPSFHRLAHDLNNVLGIVLGNAELLIDSGKLDAKCLHRVEQIFNAAGKARDMIGTAQMKADRP